MNIAGFVSVLGIQKIRTELTVLTLSTMAWLPLHHSIRELILEYNVDGKYIKDLAARLGLNLPKLAPSIELV